MTSERRARGRHCVTRCGPQVVRLYESNIIYMISKVIDITLVPMRPCSMAILRPLAAALACPASLSAARPAGHGTVTQASASDLAAGELKKLRPRSPPRSSTGTGGIISLQAAQAEAGTSS